MTPLARLLPRRTGTRRRALLAAAVATASLALLAAAAPAGAVVTEIEGVKVGLQPRNGTTRGTPGAEPGTFANETGNAVLHGGGDYAIYWDPNKQLHHEWVTNVDLFFQAMGEANLGAGFADLGQYRDRSNAITPFEAHFKGAYSDTSKFPAPGCTDPKPLKKGAVTCLTDAQLREQLQSFITTHGLPKGMGTVYYMLTPPGVTVCLDTAATRCSDYALSTKEAEEEKRESLSYEQSFCSYHGDINPDAAAEGDANTILYAAIPWSAGTAGMKATEYSTAASVYAKAFDCQDGGFSPVNHEETREEARVLTKTEQEALEKEPPKQREESEKAIALEGPHLQEPNQQGQGGPRESGDFASGLSDVLANQIAVQEMNITTDPLLNGWQDASGNEVTDFCRNEFSATAGPNGGSISGSVIADLKTEAGTLSNVLLGPSSRYYINNVFNQAEETCDGGVGLVARFTSPNPVNAGEIIGVDGMESTVSLFKGKAFAPSGPPTTTYATFSWNFGDGTPEVTGFAPGAPTCEAPWLTPCAASAFHSYQYGGTYNVTLLITDVAGNTTAVVHPVTVVGPAPPSAGGGGSGGSGGSGSSSAGTSGGSAGGSGAGAGSGSTPRPVASAAVLSRKFRTVARNGVAVRYSVNEQVAGRFEVILSRSQASRLGISGAAAAGLPAGSAPAVVIGRAIIVTQKGGRGTIHIALSKRTSQRLGRLHRATLMLRFVVRNAARVPASTTVLSSFTLTR